MGLVLGLSVTSRDVQAIVVDGRTGDGEQVDHAWLPIPDIDAFDAEEFLDPLLIDGELHAIGLTWSPGAEASAAKIRAALAILAGGAPVLEVSAVDAAAALGYGIANLTGRHYLVTCIVEPDHAVTAKVDAQRVTLAHFDRPDAALMADSAREIALSTRPRPVAFFILGSGDADALVEELADTVQRPVITAVEAHLALPRGVALAAARTASALRAPAPSGISKVGVLSSVLAGSVATFVVASGVAVWPHLAAQLHQRPKATVAASHAPQPPLPPPALAMKLTSQTRPDSPFLAKIPRPGRVAPPPAKNPPPAAGPPAPAPEPPRPRLRDRIIQQMGPIVGRLHQP